MIENRKRKLEKEEFELRRRYEKNLHSNGSGLNGLGFMIILSVFALMGCGERSKHSVCQKYKEQILYSKDGKTR